MRATTLISALLFLFLMECFAAEEHIEFHDTQTGIASKVLKSSIEWFDKGYQFYHNGSYELAIMCFNKAIELDQSYDAPWIDKGQCLKQLGRNNEALEAFDNATKINPLIPENWINKAEILLLQGKYDEAIKAYNTSLELDPDYVWSWCQKGYAFGRMGEYNESLKALDKAIEIGSGSIHGWPLDNAWYNKGVILMSLGRTAEADAAFAKAKELGYKG